MPTLSPQSQAILDRFRQQPGVTAEQASNLEAAINASPLLIDRFNEAVTLGHLRNIVPLQRADAGGVYLRDTKSIALPLIDLTSAPPTGIRRYNEGSTIFVVAHELEHGFNSADKVRAQEALEKAANRKAKSPPPHDYTLEVDNMLKFNRMDEAEAEIAGWNAVVSAAKVNNPNPTIQDVFDKTSRMVDFIDKKGVFPDVSYALKPNLAISPDMTIDPALPQNVEAMGKNYFDKAPRETALGPSRNSDYANHYGAYAVSVVIHAERNSAKRNGSEPIVLDMAKLRLNEKLLEENGLDLSAPGRTMPYVDLTTGAPGRFDHTKDVNVHVPITAASPIPPSGDPVVDRWVNALQSGDRSAAQAVEREFARSPEGQRVWSGAMAEANAEEMRQKPWLAQARDTPLFNQAMGHLDRLGPQLGQYWSREEKERLAGVIAFEAKRGRLPEIHDVVPLRDGGLMAVWEHPRDRIFDQHTGVIDSARGVDQPLRQSMQQFNDETMQQHHEANMREQQRQTQGRGMSM